MASLKITIHEAASILGVAVNADLETVKKHFRKAASASHPDKGGCKERMQTINEAYTVMLAGAHDQAKTLSYAEEMKKKREIFLALAKTFIGDADFSNWTQHLVNLTQMPLSVADDHYDESLGKRVIMWCDDSKEVFFLLKVGLSSTSINHSGAATALAHEGFKPAAYIETECFAHNRKRKLKKREWVFSGNGEDWDKPELHFPAKPILNGLKKVTTAGTEKKFSKADMVNGILFKLSDVATINYTQSAGSMAFSIASKKDCRQEILISRQVMLGSAMWSIYDTKFKDGARSMSLSKDAKARHNGLTYFRLYFKEDEVELLSLIEKLRILLGLEFQAMTDQLMGWEYEQKKALGLGKHLNRSA